MARKQAKSELRTKNLEDELEQVKDDTVVSGYEAAKRDSLARDHSL
jgi:hypothetical protein